MVQADLAADLQPITRWQYDRMVEAGLFEDQKIELLYGVIVRMSPQGSRHAYPIRKLTPLLVAAVGDRAQIQVQLPLAMPHDSEPEPDLSIVPPGDHLEDHPSEALLVVEVADTSLRRDRVHKLPLYAEGGVPEVWLVDLAGSVVEVYTEPLGATYASKRTARRGDRIRLVAFGDVEIAVDVFLPPEP